MSALAAQQSVVDAHARVLRARIGLSLRAPFFSSALMRIPFRPVATASWCQTMATDGVRIFYSPQWVSSLPVPALRGVIAHELLHVLFEHAARRGGRAPVRWNVACDHAVNLILAEQGFVLPKGGLMDHRFIGLPAEEIYARITDEGRPCTANTGPLTQAGHDSRGVLADAGADLLDEQDPRASGHRLASDPDREQQHDLLAELRNEVRAQLAGGDAALFEQECVTLKRGELDWRAILRSQMSDGVRCDWRLWPPSRRHLHRGLLMPSIGVLSPGHVVFAVDTSGSMASEDLQTAFAEVEQFREIFRSRLSVLHADTAIRHIEEFEAMDDAVFPEHVIARGRGGTDFRPVFDWLEKNAAGSASILIYATDGYGPFPAGLPDRPVIWLRTALGRDKDDFPFGAVITLAP